MSRNGGFRTVAHEMGLIFVFLGLMSLAPMPVGIIYGETGFLLSMATAPACFLLIGLLLRKVPRSSDRTTPSNALAAVAVSWLIAAVVGSLPFVFGLGMPFTDSVFEAMSGWTSTGLSLIPSVDATPHILLFWRSLTQWLGGLGIVAFMVAAVQYSGLTSSHLYRSEGRSEAIMPSVVSTAARMWEIYLILTALSIGAIFLSGVGLWDAVNLAMTAIATGGFSVHSQGVIFYHNTVLEIVLIPVMIAGATPFTLFYAMYQTGRLSFFKDRQAPLLITLVCAGSLVVFIDLVFLSDISGGSALIESVFMVTSAITCTGFQNANPFLWSHATVLFLCMLMLIGGSAASTAGGIKLSRVILAAESLVWWSRRMFTSTMAFIPFRHQGSFVRHRLAEYEIGKNMLIIMLFFFTIVASSILLMHLEPSYHQDSSFIFFDVISAISNVGISTGFVSTSLSAPSKWILIVVMWAGRLEILPVIALLLGVSERFRLNKQSRGPRSA